MEEKKSKKEVMKEIESKKPSYEQLEMFADQLSKQNQQLIMRLRTVDNMFKRLDYLFKVMENSDKFNKEFVEACSSEIELMLTVEDEEPEKSTEEK